MNDYMVVGYVSLDLDKTGIFTDGPACVITGTEENMKKYLSLVASDMLNKQMIKKTKLREVAAGIELGAMYQFDDISFERFQVGLKDKSYFSKLKIIEKQKENLDLKLYDVILEMD